MRAWGCRSWIAAPSIVLVEKKGVAPLRVAVELPEDDAPGKVGAGYSSEPTGEGTGERVRSSSVRAALDDAVRLRRYRSKSSQVSPLAPGVQTTEEEDRLAGAAGR